MKIGEKIHIPRARLISGDLDEPVVRGGGDAKFRITIALDPQIPAEREKADHIRAYLDVIRPQVLPSDKEAEIKAALGGKPAYSFVVAGNTLTDRHGILPGCAGMFVVRASSRSQPGLYDQAGAAADPHIFQPGAHVYAIIQTYYATLGDSIPPGSYAELLGVKFLEAGGQLVRRNLRVRASDFIEQGATQ